MNRTLPTLAATTILLAATASVTIAHTPHGGASCAGVYAQGDNYNPADTNTLTVAVDGVTQSQPFTSSGRLDAAIPQDGVEHTWSWAVATTNPDPAFSESASGVITCGDPAVVPPVEPPVTEPPVTPPPVEPPAVQPPATFENAPPPTVDIAPVMTEMRYTCTEKWSESYEWRNGGWVKVDESAHEAIDGNCGTDGVFNPSEEG